MSSTLLISLDSPDSADPVTFAQYAKAVWDLSRRRLTCPGEIGPDTLRDIMCGRIARESMPDSETASRTFATISCRSGLVEFQKKLAGYTYRSSANTREEHIRQALTSAHRFFHGFMQAHFMNLLRGCPAGMTPNEHGVLKIIASLSSGLQNEVTSHMFFTTVTTPSLTVHAILESLVNDGGLMGDKFLRTAENVSLAFLKKELGHTSKFEMMLQKHASGSDEPYIRFDPSCSRHYFAMKTSDIPVDQRQKAVEYQGCGAMRVKGIAGSGNTLYEDFFLTMAQLYARHLS